VIRKFLESKNPPREMILMVQKEVAQRICARPPKMNLLAVSVQFYAKPKILFYVSKNSFWPQPKVDGAALKISPLRGRIKVGVAPPTKGGEEINSKLFFKIVKAGFSQPRKKIVNNLARMLELNKEKIKNWLLENKIQPKRRAESLEIKDWIKLTNYFEKDKKKLENL
jgi:16S rRNA (adenine1518-N6/adenine1519-N6)-dimethyltransferase